MLKADARPVFGRLVTTPLSVAFLAAVLGGSCAGLRPSDGAESVSAPAPPDVRVLSAIGMRQALLVLVPEFERRTGYRVEVAFDSGGVIVDRLERGERADVLLGPRSVLDKLSASGDVAGAGVADVAASGVGVAVRSDAPDLDVSSPAAFRAAMLTADTIACPDPQMGGASGVHIANVFHRLGITEMVRPKLVLASTPSVPGTMPGDLVAAGRAQVALHQIQELLAVRGIRVVGALPSELQAKLVFTCGIHKHARDTTRARKFLSFLRSADAAAMIRETGMEPLAP